MSSTMPSAAPEITIRPIQYRDLEKVEHCDGGIEFGKPTDLGRTLEPLDQIKRWYGPLKLLSLFPNPLQRLMTAYVAERRGHLCGIIHVSPFNRTKSTWQVERVAVNGKLPPELGSNCLSNVGSQLLRHCFEKIWEARTWLIEVDVNHKSALALYRQNGFQPLAQVTYWSIEPELLASLAARDPDLPNLLPVSNADAQLLYQLDTASMPPLVRQVFDHQIQDFKINPLQSATGVLNHWAHRTESVSAYVFEPQRKAAIGHFRLTINRQDTATHKAELTVHPAYTWLYPELIAQMARVLQSRPNQALSLASFDYQPEREEYLSRIGASQVKHSLMMSRSVWHKLRESRSMALEGLQLSDVLPGLQPAGKPIPSRLSWLMDQGPTQPRLVDLPQPGQADSRRSQRFSSYSAGSPADFLGTSQHSRNHGTPGRRDIGRRDTGSHDAGSHDAGRGDYPADPSDADT